MQYINHSIFIPMESGDPLDMNTVPENELSMGIMFWSFVDSQPFNSLILYPLIPLNDHSFILMMTVSKATELNHSVVVTQLCGFLQLEMHWFFVGNFVGLEMEKDNSRASC